MLIAIAKHFVKRDISNFCFVFPNRRAGLFFRKYIEQEAVRTMVTPAIVTIEELFKRQSGLKTADQLTLLFNLYAAYTQVMEANGCKAEDFDDFIPFGQMLLTDFNDIDCYMVDAEKLLQNVDELQQLDAADEYLTDNQVKILKDLFGYSEKTHRKSFRNTWNLLLPIYNAFRELLRSKGLAYTGMLYRSVIEECNGHIDTEYERVVFVGFNALDEVERALFRAIGADKADFYWDYNLPPYSDDADNLANRFRDDNLRQFRSKEEITPSALPEHTKFYNIVTSSMTAQTLEAQKILKRLNAHGPETAVVLLDENLLLPMLLNLPVSNEDDAKINVTMGYPISGTDVVSYVEQYILHSSSKNDNVALLEELASELSGKQPINDYEAECTSQVILVLNRIALLLKEFPNIKPLDKRPLLQLIKQSISGISVSFKGEPLNGLQVMGTLETRCISFRNIIFLSFNEGVFPKSGKLNSIIPYNIRRAYNMPTTEHHDAVYAYNFYRLAAHAENVYLISDCRTDNMRSGEPSRYLNQLRYLYDADITDIAPSGDIKIAKESTEIQKPADFATKLLDGSIRLSASSLNTYLKCPFLFYLQKYLKIKEEQDESEIMEENEFGSIFHKAMELLYNDLKRQADKGTGEVTKEMLESLLNNQHALESALRMAFNTEYFKKDADAETEITGLNALQAQVMLHYIKSVLKEDSTIAPFRIVQCERDYNDKNIKFHSVTFSGKIDRIDSYTDQNGVKHLRLIDYKTGKVSDDAKRQLQFYRYMVEQDAELKGRFNAIDLNVYGVGKLGKAGGETALNLKQEDYEKFLAELDGTISEMLDSEVTIVKSQKKQDCRNCSLADICKRL